MVQAPDIPSLPVQPEARPGNGVMQRLLDWDPATQGADEGSMGLRQRLEMTALAIQTGAPLTTREVSLLLGAKPTCSPMHRAGLVASRVSRNVWQLRRKAMGEHRTDPMDHGDDGADKDRLVPSNNFGSGLGRRL